MNQDTELLTQAQRLCHDAQDIAEQFFARRLLDQPFDLGALAFPPGLL